MPFPLSHSLDLPEEVQDLLTRYVAQINEDWSTDLGGLLLFWECCKGRFYLGSFESQYATPRPVSIDGSPATCRATA